MHFLPYLFYFWFMSKKDVFPKMAIPVESVMSINASNFSSCLVTKLLEEEMRNSSFKNTFSENFNSAPDQPRENRLKSILKNKEIPSSQDSSNDRLYLCSSDKSNCAADLLLRNSLNQNEAQMNEARFDLSERPRCDSFGNQILQGNKAHKIKFNERLTTIHEVENWKEMNVVRDGESGICSCFSDCRVS